MSKKIKTLICLLLLTISALSAFAQQSKRLTVQIQNGTILDCIKSIEGQTDYSFLFSNSIGVEKKVSVNCVNQSLDQVLSAVFTQNGISYDIAGNQITLRKSEIGSDQSNGRRTITGKVTDQKGNAVVGAGIIQSGTTNGTVTGDDGSWALNIPSNGIVSLDISSLGYTSRIIEVHPDQKTINVTLDEDAFNLDELVIVGYGTTKKSDLIASVSTVKTTEITNIPVVNLSQGLAGRSPGLLVITSGGGINKTPTISIRGAGSPLYVIDGMIRTAEDFNAIAPEDIESFSILKDASATAMYGSRASNGIIQVTTKSGKNGATGVKAEYDYNYSLAQPANWPWMLGVYDRAYWSNVAKANDGLEPAFDDNAMQKFKDGSDPYSFGDWNIRKDMIRSWAPQQKHSARVFGGNSTTRYYSSLGQTNQQSLLNTGTNWMKKTTFRLAGTTDLKPIGLQLTTELDGYRTITHNPLDAQGLGTDASIFSSINNWTPNVPYKNLYGKPLSGGLNPYATIQPEAGYQHNVSNVLNAQAEAIWSCLWVDGLKVRVAGNYRYYGRTRKNWEKDPPRYAWDSETQEASNKPKLYYGVWTGYGWTTQAFIEYGHVFGKHSVFAQFGNERYYEKGENTWTKRENYLFPIDQMDIGDANSVSNGGTESELGRAAWLGQLKYNYNGKYFLEGNARYDGSDYFAPGKRWGLFFSGAAGWIVTKEPFMKSLVDRHVLDHLKIRASYGETGLDSSAGRFAYLTSYNLNNESLVVNGGYVGGFSEGSLPSPDLTWYTTRQMDLGVDFASLNNRLYGSFDYFYNSTFGYLVTPTGESYLNTAIGIALPKIKSDSEFRRAGVEIQLGWRDNIGDFSYDISGTFTRFDQLWAYNQSESETSFMNPYLRTQQQRGYYGTMYHSLGYYTNAEDVFSSVANLNAINSGYLTAGDLKYDDVNGDGQITSADYRRLGKNSFPRGQFGLNINLGFKGFYLSALFQGSTSFNMYMPGAMAMQTGNSMLFPVLFAYQTDTWTPDNRGSQYPRLMSNTNLNVNNNYLTSDFWLVDGAYVRLKDFQFGYDFKTLALRKIKWLSKAKVGVSGMNLFTLSKASKYGLDPENGSTNNYAYPVERILALTVNIGF